MTTKVTVEPSGHRIQIVLGKYSTSETTIENGSIQTSASTSQIITLEPGAAPWSGYLTDGVTINVRELPPEKDAEQKNLVLRGHTG